jgi:hypothetical protein
MIYFSVPIGVVSVATSIYRKLEGRQETAEREWSLMRWEGQK